MKGLLLDVNVENFAELFPVLLDSLNLLGIFQEAGIGFHKMRELGLSPRTPDRVIWNACQEHELIFFTDNRNNDGVDSLEATILDSLTEHSLPVLTPSDKGKLQTSRDYQELIAHSVAEMLFQTFLEGKNRGVGRLFVP